MMKKNLLIFMFLICCVEFAHSSNNPVANPKAIVTSGDMRFTVLTPQMIRIEWSGKQLFEDRASFSVINRNLPVPAFTVKEKDGFLQIKTKELTLRYKIGTFPGTKENPQPENLTITFVLNGQIVEWYPGKSDPLNLKGTIRTLDNVDADSKKKELEDGLISRSGWAVIDEKQVRSDGSLSLMFDGSEGVDWVAQRKDKESQDWYFMGYGHNYKQALSDFTKISGKIPMPPLYAFGYWYSKYQRYTEQDFMDIVNDIKANEIPIDVMVIDMDWHLDGWTGWTWNRQLIPDPKGLLAWMHDKNLKTTLNLHPADGVGLHEAKFLELAADLGAPTDKPIAWNLESKPFYTAFFKDVIRPLERTGVDFWWIDWQQWLTARNEPDLGNTFWLNHVFFSDKKLQAKGRPMIFHRWGGLGNHRYPIGFSGDTFSNYPSLAFQPYFTATASNVGYGYWSHDIGGHQQFGENDPELYLRWIQYGVFSPIVRTHSANFAHIERRIWKYSNAQLMKQALELRYTMIPYIYTQARVAYDTGISICRPLYYDLPDNDQAYQQDGEYMFGDDILVAPITDASDKATGLNTKNIWLPKGSWYEVTSGQMLVGDKSYTRTFTQSDIPHYYKAGSIIPFYPPQQHLKNRPQELIIKFTPGSSGELMFYEDENDNDNYQDGVCAFTKITQKSSKWQSIYTIHPTQGGFEGMLDFRNYELELLAVSQPKKVVVNGKVLETNGWNYDTQKRCVKITIPKVMCTDKTEVKVDF